MCLTNCSAELHSCASMSAACTRCGASAAANSAKARENTVSSGTLPAFPQPVICRSTAASLCSRLQQRARVRAYRTPPWPRTRARIFARLRRRKAAPATPPLLSTNSVHLQQSERFHQRPMLPSQWAQILLDCGEQGCLQEVAECGSEFEVSWFMSRRWFRKGSCVGTNYPIDSSARCKHSYTEMFRPRSTDGREYCKCLFQSAAAYQAAHYASGLGAARRFQKAAAKTNSETASREPSRSSVFQEMISPGPKQPQLISWPFR